MDTKNSLDDLRKIRSLMERSSIYHSLSGLSGIAAGLIGIIVFAAVYGIVDPMLESAPEMKYTKEGRDFLMRIFFLSSAICLLLSFVSIFYFNYRKAKSNNLSFFEPAMQSMFINLFIPLSAGGIYCLMLVKDELYLLIPATMLIFYGLGLIMASRHTIVEIRYLGLIELFLGCVGIFLKEYSMMFWLAGFGFVNLIYGAYIYFRYERGRNTQSISEPE